MKYFIISSLILIGSFSSQACECYDLYSFCDVLNNSSSRLDEDYSKIVCYVEYTGNNQPFLADRPQHGLFEVKIIDLFYGEIQPGGYPGLIIGEDFLNTDSTFWVISGSDSCDDIFIFEEGDYALMATSAWDGGYLAGKELNFYIKVLPFLQQLI